MCAGLAEGAAGREVNLDRKKAVGGEIVTVDEAMSDSQGFVIGNCGVTREAQDKVGDEGVGVGVWLVPLHVRLVDQILLCRSRGCESGAEDRPGITVRR